MPRLWNARVLALTASLLALSACGGGAGDAPAEDAAVFNESVDQELVVRAAKNAMRYEDTRIEAPAGSRVRIVMDNSTTTSPAMTHNVVVLRDGEQDTIFRVGGAAAGAPGNIPADPAILAYTPMAQPGGRTAVVLTMPPAGEYPFICTYPGHFTMMQGTLVSTPG